ncbi:hypothetical protein P3X46_009939 [Hevea brasiliensis]|uniref:Glycosyl transferase 64 domain-containing protein n=1 Tax=Hevea brasiliensis TaxID=3981 RepID=A0ABQ9MCM7_HEVBR|nr:glycosyltransferase family protein 64 C3 [Hevea brasiliensis]XP_058004173.1 glycosyltransferase family protein 64 C3 [Hevea brasiliensis]KAJ9178019.1 hypothetical protein P3X46_009939 [Hevea brasiliensis]
MNTCGEMKSLLKFHIITSMVNVLLYVCLLLTLPLGVFPLRTLPSDPCDPANEPDPRNLRPDQITVLINGYSESRIPLLQTIAATYSASALVSSVLVLWGNPSTSSQTLAHLAHNLSLSSFGPATISLVRQPSSSLNDRFLPRSSIGTQAVLICDDDVEVDPKSFDFAFRIWRSNPDNLIGFFVRSHDLDLSARKWIYTVHPDKYSIVLTKFMILKSQYLFEYSCKGGSNMSEMRKIVDQMQNCEDILMNFVVADHANKGPILVGAERVRDWGDARNDDNDDGKLRLKDEEGKSVRAVGLSSRRAEHRRRRGECIREFHKLLGRMPLRYSYGKVLNSVGEQGLCMKGGKLVFCDQYQ